MSLNQEPAHLNERAGTAKSLGRSCNQTCSCKSSACMFSAEDSASIHANSGRSTVGDTMPPGLSRVKTYTRGGAKALDGFPLEH